MTPDIRKVRDQRSDDTSPVRTLALVVAALLLGAWTAWFLTPVVAVSALDDVVRSSHATSTSRITPRA